MLTSRKGQEPLTVVMMVGILIVVISSIYFWGVPLIEKNKDVASLKATESFMEELNNKVRDIANNGGREQVTIEKGIVSFSSGSIKLFMETGGTYYAEDVWIPLGNGDCNLAGTWGVDPPEALCVKSGKIGSSYQTTYELRYRVLGAGSKQYQISL
ncbi:MAG: hypothetical protein HZB67_03740, partial [Candidatus Aenigmarchaeota archaeon]|nr:hypothetical protein [Candidatus Aenigmarchaeota archaeon]